MMAYIHGDVNLLLFILVLLSVCMSVGLCGGAAGVRSELIFN